jgi:subtilisin family serine protease
MKKIYLLLIVITGFLFLLLSSAITEEGKYYYAFKEKVFLFPKKNTLLVKYSDGIDKAEAEEFIKKEVPSGFKVKWHNPQTVEITTGSEEIANALRKKLESNNGVSTCQPFYILKDGLDMGVTDEVLIRFYPGISEEQKAELIKTFDTEVVKTTKIYQKLRVKKGVDALKVANKIYESGLVEFSTPNFISYPELHQIIPNDTYFSKQITCHNTGQTFTDGHSGTNDADIDAPEAWGITTGCSDIVVAVLDEGVTSNHPDLPNSRQVRLNRSNFADGNANDPSPTGNNNHGNACAGVIAATMNNNQGIAGIAPECKIMPVRIFNSDGSGILTDSLASAIQFAVDNGVNILSNSWGYPSSNQNLHPVIVTAINYALNNNCVVIFSAGNTANHTDNNNGYVQFPANVNISGVITVGASDRNDYQANYSPTSSLIDIVAPSHKAYPCQISGETFEMWTIDIPGDNGYNSWHESGICYNPPQIGEVLPNSGTNYQSYTTRFGGTSHSCPVVAGVAALILSVNPDLSYMDVFNILTSTADKVGGYTYSNGRCNQLGYGRVNAYAALKAVCPLSGPTLVCSSGSSYSIQNVPTGATITWTPSPNITRVSTQGSNPCIFEANEYGNGWIDATINNGCTTITLPRKNVSTDMPGISQLHDPNCNYCQVSYGNVGTTYMIAALTDNTSTYAYDYYWEIYPPEGSGWDEGYADYGKQIYYSPPVEGTYIVKLRQYWDCGWSDFSVEEFEFYGGYGLSFTPNPASGETLLTIEPKVEEKTFDSDIDWNMEIYSETQLLITKQTGLHGKSAKIRTAGWREGVYLVRVKYKDEVLTGKLVVKK